MGSLATIAGAGGTSPRKGRKGRHRRGSCVLGDTKRVPAGKGYTQELECTGRGATGWQYVKGTRRRGR